jgi:hypothetical protein
MLVKGRTAIEGTLGSGGAGFCAGGIDAVVVGGRSERCCTNTITATMSASPHKREDAATPVFSQGALRLSVGCASDGPALHHHPEHPHRLGDVLDRLLAEILIAERQLVSYVFVNSP